MSGHVVIHLEPVKDNWTEDKDLNKCIVETAGFVPLEVKFKQFEQNGIKAQFLSSEFDSSDMRDIYLGEDTTIYSDDDLEDVQRKLFLQAKVARSISSKKKLAENDERSEEVQASHLNDKKEVKEDVKGDS